MIHETTRGMQIMITLKTLTSKVFDNYNNFTNGFIRTSIGYNLIIQTKDTSHTQIYNLRTSTGTVYIEKTVIAIPFKHYIGNKFAKT